jgi:hypothetical protein
MRLLISPGKEERKAAGRPEEPVKTALIISDKSLEMPKELPWRPMSQLGVSPHALGPKTLRDGVLLAHWYILYRLDEEMERARRYRRPLSIMLARPLPVSGEQPNALACEVGAAAAQATARLTDLLGWLGRDAILVIMPETGQADANAAASRWRNEMQSRGQPVGGHEWQVAAVENDDRFERPDQLLDCAAQHLARREAA